MFLAPHPLPDGPPRHTPANSFMHRVLIKFSSRQLRCKSRRIANQVQRELQASTFSRYLLSKSWAAENLSEAAAF